MEQTLLQNVKKGGSWPSCSSPLTVGSGQSQGCHDPGSGLWYPVMGEEGGADLFTKCLKILMVADEEVF